MSRPALMRAAQRHQGGGGVWGHRPQAVEDSGAAPPHVNI